MTGETQYQNKKEIEHPDKLIEDSEAILGQMPGHLRPFHEIALRLHRECMTKLETMLANNIMQAKG